MDEKNLKFVLVDGKQHEWLPVNAFRVLLLDMDTLDPSIAKDGPTVIGRWSLGDLLSDEMIDRLQQKAGVIDTIRCAGGAGSSSTPAGCRRLGCFTHIT